MALYISNDGVARQEGKVNCAVFPISGITSVGKRSEDNEYLKSGDVVYQGSLPACEITDIRLMVNKPMPAGSKINLGFVNKTTGYSESIAENVVTDQEGVIVVDMPIVGHYYGDGTQYDSIKGGIWVDANIGLGFANLLDVDPGDYEIDVVYTFIERAVKSGAYLS